MSPRVKKGTQALLVNLPETGTETEDEAPDGEQREAESLVEDVVAELPSRSIVKLYRMDQRTATSAYLDTIDQRVFSIEYVQKVYGGGDYTAEFRGPPKGKGNSRTTYQRQKSFTIDHAIPPKYPRSGEAEPATAPVAPVPAVPTGGSMTDQVIAASIMTMLQQMQSMSAAQAKQAQDHSVMMLGMFQKMAEKPATDPLLMTLLTSMLDKKADPIEQATRIAEIQGKSARSGSVAEILQMMEVMDKLKERTGDGGGEKGWADIVTAVAPHLLQNAAAADAATAGRAVAVPAPAATPVPRVMPGPARGPVVMEEQVPLTGEDGGNVPMPYVLLYRLLGDVRKAARGNRDPQLTADWLAEDIPPGDVPMIMELLDKPSCVTDLCTFAPDLAPYAAWLDKFRLELLAVLRGDGEDDDTEGENDGG